MAPPAPANPVHNGTKVNAAFTIMNGRRYAFMMLLFAVAVITVSAQPDVPRTHVSATAQATAMVRVISGVRVRLDGQYNGNDIPQPRDAVFTSGGVQQPARFIEFQ
jgi:hypothetical protein